MTTIETCIAALREDRARLDALIDSLEKYAGLSRDGMPERPAPPPSPPPTLPARSRRRAAPSTRPDAAPAPTKGAIKRGYFQAIMRDHIRECVGEFTPSDLAEKIAADPRAAQCSDVKMRTATSLVFMRNNGEVRLVRREAGRAYYERDRLRDEASDKERAYMDFRKTVTAAATEEQGE